MSDRDIRRQRQADRIAAAGNTKQCPVCKTWIICFRGRMKLDSHIETAHPQEHAEGERYRAQLLGDSR